MKRFLLFFLITLIMTGCGSLCGERKLKVVTTLFPYYDFARSIGGTRTDVVLLLKPGIEAHGYKPSDEDIKKITGCDIFIYNGAGMEAWVPGILSSPEMKNVMVIDASSVAGKRLIQGSTVDDDIDQQSHTGIDPHLWLDFTIDISIVDAILSAMSSLDPAGAEYYSSNAAIYRTRLVQLDAKYAEVIKSCDFRIILHAGHYSAAYLCARYKLKLASPYADFTPYPDPSPRSIAQLNIKIGLRGGKYIFYDEIMEPKVAKIISEETGSGMLLFHAAHNITQKELDSGTDFIRIMDENLERLKTGLVFR